MTAESRTREELAEENRQLRAQLEALQRERDATREAEMPFASLFEASPIPTAIYRSDGILVAVNSGACAMLGVSADAVLGKFNVWTDPHSIEMGYAGAFERALHGETTRLPANSFEPAKSGIEGAEAGHVCWSESTYVPLKSPSGEIFVAEVIVDVTPQKEAEARMNASAALLTAIIDNAPMLVYVKDRAGRYTLVNRQVEELLATPRAELLGKMDRDFFSPEAAAEMRAQDVEVLASGPKSFEDKIQGADGPRTYITTKFPLGGPDGAGEVAGISADITARVRAEEANRALEEQVLRAHEEALRALSTPLLPIAEGVLVMPLIGEVNGARAQQVLTTLLRGITEQHARIAILDVTGMSSSGSTSASELSSALTRLASAVRLLGVELVVTGIQPSVARALVEQGSDSGAFFTQATLQSGVQYAFTRQVGERR